MRLLPTVSPARKPDLRNASKWKRRLLAGFVLFLSLLISLPILITATPLRNWLLARALPQFQGSIRIGGASMGWFRPPIFTDIEVRDNAGRMLLHVPRLEGSKTLAALLRHPFDLGEYRLTQPVLHIVCSRDSSNLEAALAYWLQKRETPSTCRFGLDGIAIRAMAAQASIILEDEASGRSWSLAPLDLTAAVPCDRRTPLHLELKATAADAQASGRISAELSAHFVETSDGPPRLRAEGELHAEQLPLDAAEPFLRRLHAPIELAGRMHANLKIRPSDGQAGSPDVRLEGSISLQALALSDSLLGPDVLRLQQVQAPLRIALDGSRLSIEQLEMQSEAGKISLAGTMDWTKNLRDTLIQPGHRIDAELNLARLAQLIPNTLHLTKDTRVQSGTLSLHLNSARREDVVHWQGDLHTSDLEGMYQGQRVTWKEPFAVVLAAHQEGNDPLPVLERFRCDSDFLRLEMSGSPRDWTARGSFNLGRLTEHLDSFVELGSLRVQGEGTLRATARCNPRGGFRLESDVGLAQLRMDEGARAWREDSLTVHLDLVGDTSNGYRVNAGALHVLAGKDGIDVDLLEPIALRVEGGGGRDEPEALATARHPSLTLPARHATRLRLHVHGDLARWQGRIASLTGFLNDVRLGGQIDVDGRLRYEPETIGMEDLKVAGRGVQLQGFGLNVNEPVLDFTTSGRWLPGRQTLELQHTRLSCPSVTVQAPAATLGIDPAGVWLVTASAAVQGDVSRLLQIPCLRGGLVGGALAGRIDLRPDQGRQIVQLDANVQNLLFGSPAAPLWRESRVNFIGHGVYDAGKDSLQIVQLHLDSPAASCDAAGRLAALRTDMDLSLEGKLDFDLDKMGPQLQPYLGPGVKLSGREMRPFHLAGALRGTDGEPAALAAGYFTDITHPAANAAGSPLTRLHGDTALAWQTLQALGFQVGPAELRGQLSNGCFHAAPIDAALNQGRLHLEPTLRLDPWPPELTLAKGRAIEHAHLSPLACASALGYAVPVLAGVAQAEGEFSLDLQSGRVPLLEPAKGDVVGWCTLHSAQVSAGPLVQELSVLLKGPATLTLAKDNIVPFRMVNGRVYHTGLELHFPELTMRLSGSVGLDGSLALTAEMPVPPKWIGSSRLAKAALANQIIRLPIGGTLEHPKIDEHALSEAAAKFVGNAAGNLLRQELDGQMKKETEKGLRKLFRRK